MRVPGGGGGGGGVDDGVKTNSPLNHVLVFVFSENKLKIDQRRYPVGKSSRKKNKNYFHVVLKTHPLCENG